MAPNLDAIESQATRDFGPLLVPLQRVASERMFSVMEAVMRRTDDYLFDRAGEGAELTALRDLRRARGQVTQHFADAVVAGFSALLQASSPSQPNFSELSLVSEDALEELLATEQLVDNLHRKHAMALELLEQRLAVVLEVSALGPGQNPVGPGFLANALRGAISGVDLSTGVRIALYKFMERELSDALIPLYDRMNAGLSEAGILPRLLPSAPTVSNSPAELVQSDPSTSQTAKAPEQTSDHALFSSLVGLLQSWRQRGGMSSDAQAGGGAEQPMGAPELMSVLSLMQGEVPAALGHAVDGNRLSLAEQLRNEVLAGARRLGVGGGNPNLSNVQEDAVGLVGMLFEVLLDERDFEPVVRDKIGRMLVPYVKVAVKDRRLFLYKGHPARRLLNAVTEACEGNHGEGPQERELLDHVDAVIDRLVAEFNEDVAIFETLELELRSFLSQHRQRIAIAERRAAEAQRGRERLEQARGEATADLATRRNGQMLPPVLDDFAARFLTHHMTQVILRESSNSPQYAESLHVFEGVLAAVSQAGTGASVEAAASLDDAVLAKILSSSGCIGSAADEAIETIKSCLRGRTEDAGTSAQAAQLPDTIVPVAVAATVLTVVGGRDTLDFDDAVAERMRALLVGTWLQLTGESGRVEPAKVSWISPISSRFLFVNRRGIRVLVASAEELAAMAKQGRVQLRQADTAFDDAMHQMVGRLRASESAAA